MIGRIHSFESFGAADGPGVRFCLFLSGCPFRCLYCHNPDTWARPAVFEMTADNVLAKALRYRAYWGAEGGITVSGGEPMLQSAFVTELFEKAHAAGVTTCLDTAAGPFLASPEATEPASEIARLLTVTDTVLLDIKHIDDDAHKRLTGFSNAAPLACARYLSEHGITTWIRHVLVPGINTDIPTLERTAAFLRTLKNIARIDVLPYHRLGIGKWRELGLTYALPDTDPPTREQLDETRRLLTLGGQAPHLPAAR